MLDFLFFVKRVKNIINNFDDDTTDLQTINQLYNEFSSVFQGQFVLYNLNGKRIFGENLLQSISDNSCKRLLSSNDSLYNIDICNYFYEDINIKKGSIVPLSYKNNKSIAVVYKNENKDFTDEEIAILEMFFITFYLYFNTIIYNKKTFEHNKENIIKKAISNLSYSELEAMHFVFNSFSGSENVIVASKISSIHNISRSVIVSGLKKLAVSNAIITKSMGNKGTYIKILYKDIRQQLK